MLEEIKVDCPYCGESFASSVEVLDESQHYIEDCYVCCRPIVFNVHVAINGDWDVYFSRESDI